MDEKLRQFLENNNNTKNEKIREVCKYPNLSNRNTIIQSIINDKLIFEDQDKKINSEEEKTLTINQLLEEYEDIYNCLHYECNVLIYTSCCNKIYPCRQCHDTHEEHKLDRYKIDTIICKKCNEIQEKSHNCSKCGIVLGTYYCDICCLYQTEEKDIYHCHKCNICRIGLKDNYQHCDNCNMCFQNEHYNNHVCSEHFKNKCGICMEDIFDSTFGSFVLRCNHVLHSNCFNNYIKSDFKCPICKKSISDNMKDVWDNIRNINIMNKTPEEYKYWRVKIYCNDCDKYCETAFQITSYHECDHCNGYNTHKIDLIKKDISPEDILRNISENMSETISNNILDTEGNENDIYTPTGLTDVSTSELSDLDSSFEENISDTSSSD